MSGDGLDVYWGGLLYNACLPMEISLNWCSAACRYCFSNLNKPDRRADAKQIFNLLGNYRKGKSYCAHLLQQGYPIVMSNHVDPFAASNDAIALPIIQNLTDQKIPFSLQTKGGKRFYDALEIIDRPIVFYWSIATLNDDLAAQIEPGAPPPSERLKMMKAAIAKGHKVNAGINPTVPDWLPHPQELTDRLAEIGAWGAWVQNLHLSHKQLKNMSEKGKAAMGDRVIQQALYPSKYPETHEQYLKTTKAAIASGLHVYDNQQGKVSHYFQPYRECYEKTFPLMQDFVNYCHARLRPGDPVYYANFEHFFLRKLPAGVWDMAHHIYAHVRASSGAFKDDPVVNRMSYKTLLKRLWRDRPISLCPVYTDCFTFAADWEVQKSGEEAWTLWTDAEGLPILLFKPNEANELCTQWNPNSLKLTPLSKLIAV